MTFPFSPDGELVIIQGTAFGPRGLAIVKLALDTGATGTMLNAGTLAFLGYEPDKVNDKVQMITGSSIETVPRIQLIKFIALGNIIENYTVLSHNLPPSTAVDGLLGLDFFRRKKLTIDFELGLISVE